MRKKYGSISSARTFGAVTLDKVKRVMFKSTRLFLFELIAIIFPLNFYFLNIKLNYFLFTFMLARNAVHTHMRAQYLFLPTPRRRPLDNGFSVHRTRYVKSGWWSGDPSGLPGVSD